MTTQTTRQPAAQVPAQTYPPIDIAAELGVPLTQRGQPDFANHVPRRLVSLDEAKARGWSRFWDSRACRYGHQASRKVANPASCSDCDREKAAQPPIYPRSRAQEFYTAPRRPPKVAPLAVVNPGAPSTPNAAPAPPVLIMPAPVPKAPEPDATDKAFLTKYAELRDLEAAALACGVTAAQINSRRSHQKPLDESMTRLEAELAIPKYVPAPTDFEWDEDKRARLLEAYVDSGNLAIARDAIKCTPSQLWRELDANPKFSAQLDAARVRAAQVFEEVAHAQALAGNDRLLPIVLKAERPDKYTERQRLDVFSENSRLTDEQLNTRLFTLLERAGVTLVEDARPIDVTPGVTDGELIDAPALPGPASAPRRHTQATSL